MDAGTGGLGEFRARLDIGADEPGDGANHITAAGRALEARQAMDHQPRSGVCAKKSARDRLIEFAAQQPEYVLGFQDEVWWSRVTQPHVHAWTAEDTVLRLVEQTTARDDPDPKALACYGLLVSCPAAPATLPEQV